jgi:hypothetical protein
MNEYAVVPSEGEALNLITRIDKQKGFSSTWCEPIRHPVDAACLIRIDWSQLDGCQDILSGLSFISEQQAKMRGWYFGPFSGTFAREKQKMEDIHFLFDAIVDAYGKPNFPALRSLIVSFMSACYALKESLKTKAKDAKLQPMLGIWWDARRREMDAPGELLHLFERYMHTEKHGGALARQISSMDLSPVAAISELVVTSFPPGADPGTLKLSSEGAFVIAHSGTPMERRLPVGVHQAKYEVVVNDPPTLHLGTPLLSLALPYLLQVIRDYYANLLFDAGHLIGEGPMVAGARRTSDSE